MDSESVLRGTPYLIESDSLSQGDFKKNREASQALRSRALSVAEGIRKQASGVMEPFMRATRTDLVAESNIIEGYVWSKEEVREVVLKHSELLSAPTRNLLESVKSDARVYEVLGLYRAHEVAEEWLNSDLPPTAAEVRELHRLILGDQYIAGRYKTGPNHIEGSELQTAEPMDVQRLMLELSDWWRSGSEDPVLTATVVHAWLVHVHPFMDGNGRLARVLANLELARNDYPPLVLRAESDRSEYYAALAESDDGNILPLYKLFVRVMRRQVRLMASPNYVDELIDDRFLATERDKHQFWLAVSHALGRTLGTECRAVGLQHQLQGVPDIAGFSSLWSRDSAGNGWFSLVGRDTRYADWLIWYGYRSRTMSDLSGSYAVSPFPSLFLSRRDESPDAPHPFVRVVESDPEHTRPFDEIGVYPGRSHPIAVRRGLQVDWLTVEAAGKKIVSLLRA